MRQARKPGVQKETFEIQKQLAQPNILNPVQEYCSCNGAPKKTRPIYFSPDKF
jgi:hypothetical protein